MTSNTSAVQDRLHFQVKRERACTAFGQSQSRRSFLRSDHTFRDRDLVLVFMTTDTGNHFARLTGHPASHPLDSHAILIQRLDGDRCIGRSLEDHGTVFFDRNRPQHTLDIPTGLDSMPVMVGTSLYIRIFVSMQTQRLDRSARNTFQTFSFVDILNKEGRFLFIQFHTVGNGRRSLCLAHQDRADIAFAFCLHQTGHVVVDVHQIESPQGMRVQLGCNQEVFVVQRSRFDELRPYTVYQLVLDFFFDRTVTVRDFLYHTGCALTSLGRIEDDHTA